MSYPFYSLAMLGLESASVINKRLTKIGRGGSQSTDEIRLMFEEKKDASIEAGMALMFGGTPMDMIARFRKHVAVNELRLSS